jgi:hypothetical protein
VFKGFKNVFGPKKVKVIENLGYHVGRTSGGV